MEHVIRKVLADEIGSGILIRPFDEIVKRIADAVREHNGAVEILGQEAERPVRSVLQEWVMELSMMQQTVLLSAIRGADGFPKHHGYKALMRWYRRCVLLSAMDGKVLTTPQDPGGGSFTGPSIPENHIALPHWPAAMEPHIVSFLESRDEMPLHYFTHAMHAFQILGYKHPDHVIRYFWYRIYERVVHTLHLWPETEEQMDQRLGDTVQGWLAREDPANK